MPNSLTVAEMAVRSGVAPSTLRYYERIGLIRPAAPAATSAGTSARNCGGWRSSACPSRSVSRWTRSVTRWPCWRAGSPTRADWARLSVRWRRQLDARITQLERLRDDLTGCIGCGCLSLRRCRLYNPGDALARRGPGPRLLVDG